MINPIWIDTDRIYHRLLEAPDAETRHAIYMNQLVAPWAKMMQMMGVDPTDPLAGAKRWAWALPDQIDLIADLLSRLEAADAWNVGRAALTEAIAQFEPYADRLAFDQVTGWLMLADPTLSNGYEDGCTGAIDWFEPRFIGQFWNPNADNLPRLPGLIAHEMHHLIRLRAFPWGPQISVADYIVVEGTAESFAASRFGEQHLGRFVTDISPADFEIARRMIGGALDVTGFDKVRGYLFGDALAAQSGFAPIGGVPMYAGYAVGYHVVQAFLKQSGCSIEETTFLPAKQIVEESGFFR